MLPLWPPATDPTYERLSDFRADLRDWYFNDGGWLFSTESRQAFEALQKLLGEIIKADGTADGQIKPSQYDAIRCKCSALRPELTNDLQSRKRAMFVWQGSLGSLIEMAFAQQAPIRCPADFLRVAAVALDHAPHRRWIIAVGDRHGQGETAAGIAAAIAQLPWMAPTIVAPLRVWPMIPLAPQPIASQGQHPGVVHQGGRLELVAQGLRLAGVAMGISEAFSSTARGVVAWCLGTAGGQQAQQTLQAIEALLQPPLQGREALLQLSAGEAFGR